MVTTKSPIATLFAFLFLLPGIALASSYDIVNFDPESVDSGVNIVLDVTIENTDTQTANDVRVWLSSFDPEIVVTGGRKVVGSLESGNEVELDFGLDIGDPGEGDHEMLLTIRDRRGTVTKTFYLDAEGADDDELNTKKSCSKDLKVLGYSLVNERDSEINPTDKVEISLYLKSRTTYKIDEIVATIGEDLYEVRADGNWQYYDFISKGETRGGSFMVYTYDAEQGQYVLDLEVEYDKEGHECTQSFEFNITVKGNYEASIELAPDSVEVLPDSTLELYATIRNVGGNEDSYHLEFFEGVTDWVHEAPSEIFVGPGEEKIVPITLYIPDVRGSYHLGAKAVSNTLYTVTDSDITFITVQEVEEEVHMVAIDYPSEPLFISPGETKTVEVGIENLGNVGESLRVSLDGPYWAFITPAEFYLDAGERRMVSLYFAPNVDEESGTEEIEIRAVTKQTGASAEENIGVYVGAPGGASATGMVTAGVAGADGSVGDTSAQANGGSGRWYLLPLTVAALALGGYVVWKFEKEERIH